MLEAVVWIGLLLMAGSIGKMIWNKVTKAESKDRKILRLVLLVGFLMVMIPFILLIWAIATI